MLFRLATFFLLGAVAACQAPVAEEVPVTPMTIEAAPIASSTQVRERAELCAKATTDRFRRDWKARASDGMTSAEFLSHYNAKANVCFYLVTVRVFAIGEGGAGAGRLTKVLFDFGGEEKYGEFVGPAFPGSPADRFSARCKVDELFCSSEAEWDRLARYYMEE